MRLIDEISQDFFYLTQYTFYYDNYSYDDCLSSLLITIITAVFSHQFSA